MKNHVLLLTAVLSITSELAFAGAGTGLTITNYSNQDAVISSGDSLCWDPRDLGNTTVRAHETKTLYTEAVNSGGCNSWINSVWQQSFKIKIGSLSEDFRLRGNNDPDYYKLCHGSQCTFTEGKFDFAPMSGYYCGNIVITNTNDFDDSKMNLSRHDSLSCSE